MDAQKTTTDCHSCLAHSVVTTGYRLYTNEKGLHHQRFAVAGCRCRLRALLEGRGSQLTRECKTQMISYVLPGNSLSDCLSWTHDTSVVSLRVVSPRASQGQVAKCSQQLVSTGRSQGPRCSCREWEFRVQEVRVHENPPPICLTP